MNLFSISDLQKFSGVKAHTIRMWEQRYKALKPRRTDGNTRYYDGSQLRRLLNIVSLLSTDFKVSELCSMPDASLNRLLDEQFSDPIQTDESAEYFISQIISAAVEFDEIRFDKLFSNCILRFGVKKTYIKVIYPALNRLGLMWSKDSLHPVQEHFITHLIDQKLEAAVDALPPPSSQEDSWLLFLPENEFHETGLLMSNFLIRQAGKKTFYLGANVPFDSLKVGIEKINPARLLFFLVHRNGPEEDATFIKHIVQNFPLKKIYAACDESRLKKIKTGRNFTQIHSVADLEKELN